MEAQGLSLPPICPGSGAREAWRPDATHWPLAPDEHAASPSPPVVSLRLSFDQWAKFEKYRRIVTELQAHLNRVEGGQAAENRYRSSPQPY
jgi:hypothetical protein